MLVGESLNLVGESLNLAIAPLNLVGESLNLVGESLNLVGEPLNLAWVVCLKVRVQSVLLREGSDQSLKFLHPYVTYVLGIGEIKYCVSGLLDQRT
jgi:hypothetical protein